MIESDVMRGDKRMTVRVLHVVTDMRRGGLETMLMNYYRKIDRNKVQFDFLEHRQEESDYDREIKKMGGKIHRIPRLNPFSIHYKSALYEFFKDHPEYQIVHVHQDCLSSIILKAAQKCGVKVRIAHSHSSNQDKNLKYLLKLYYMKKIPQYATQLFACSEEAGKWMFCGADFDVLNNAIDAKRYIYSSEVRAKRRKEFGIEEDTIVVGHVGRFWYPKNHMFLLDIFQKIADKTDAKLLLVGDGRLRADIEKKIQQLHLEDKVILTGVRNDVAELLQAMDVFVFPSIYEGLPVTIIEAQAAGLSCLISDKVPIECKKTDLVTQIDLDKPAEHWAENAIQVSETERKDMYEEIEKSGYDIEKKAEELVDFYLKMGRD